jgi:PIN domain nuclease of toxin-antitoxin system
MKLLLDTHTFIWWDSQRARLSSDALILCQNKSNGLFLSMASIWEMQIKIQLGKLKFSLPLEDVIKDQQKANNIQLLPIEFDHILRLEKLPLHHKDPFDRLLIAQAQVEDMTVISNDAWFMNYAVKLRW